MNNKTQVLRFEIASESRNVNHTVELKDGEWSCTCEHHKYRGAECKHIREAQKQLQTLQETGDVRQASNIRADVVDVTDYASLKLLLALKKELSADDVDFGECKSLVEDLLLKI